MNPWLALRPEAPCVLDKDGIALAKFNERATARTRLETALLPEPFVGHFNAAGFRDTREDRRSMALPWPGSPNELWQHLYDVAIPLRPLFDGLSGDERAAAIGESVAGYAKYYGGKSVNVPASIVTVSART